MTSETIDVEVHHADPRHGQVVLIDWMLGNSCNHACSYCPANLHDGSLRWQRREEVVGFLDQLRDHYVDGLGRQVWVQFTGGEPTMYPALKDVLAYARSIGFKQSVISNGSRTERFWRQIISSLDSVIFTYHDEFVEHEPFVKNCQIAAEQAPIQINVTVHPDRFDDIIERAKDLAEKIENLYIVLKPLRIGFGGQLYGYTPEQLAALKQRLSRRNGAEVVTPRGIMVARDAEGRTRRRRANEFIIDGENRWSGYRCEAGIESLRVKGDGDVTRAVCGVGGLLGKLGEPVDLPVSSVRCTRELCSCVADILITKRRTEPRHAVVVARADAAHTEPR